MGPCRQRPRPLYFEMGGDATVGMECGRDVIERCIGITSDMMKPMAIIQCSRYE